MSGQEDKINLYHTLLAMDEYAVFEIHQDSNYLAELLIQEVKKSVLPGTIRTKREIIPHGLLSNYLYYSP